MQTAIYSQEELDAGVSVALVDWYGGTFPEGVSVETVQGLLGGEGWVPLDRGHHGYRQALRRGHVTIYHDGKQADDHGPGMGVFLEVSGKGCRELEAGGQAASWPELIGRLRAAGIRETRVDVAVDDLARRIELDQVRASVRGGLVVSRWKGASMREDACLASGEPDGGTVYFGSRQSDKSLRMYDKGKQLGLAESFVRVELETRREQAQAMAGLIEAGVPLGEALHGVLAASVSFRERGTHSQRERWPLAAWWAAFLGDVEKIRLSIKPIVRTLVDLFGWVRRQVAPALAVLVAATGGGVHVLEELAGDGRARWRPWHRALVAGAVAGAGG